MPTPTINTPYSIAMNAVSGWCATNGFAPRAEFLSQGNNATPEKFVMWRINNEEFKRFKDNEPPFVDYYFTFYVGAVDNAENRAALYAYHFQVLSALRTAGFIPQNGFEMGIDKEAGRVYIAKDYNLTMKVGDIVP